MYRTNLATPIYLFYLGATVEETECKELKSKTIFSYYWITMQQVRPSFLFNAK